VSGAARTRAAIALAGITGAAGVATANNDLSSAGRGNISAAPSISGESATTASGVGVNQGRASYSIPVVAPPGRPGVEPGLALVYTGTQSEGEAGVGWSLSVPQIRVRTTGRGGQPAFGVGVVYQGFSGQDLIDTGDVPDSDGDGLPETAYREERDLAFDRYLALSGGGWRVQQADGRELTFGVDPANRIVRAGFATSIAAWLPERLVDPSGNELTYTWATAAALDATAISPTARYLTEVRYGCTACASATTYQRVTLGWARRAVSVLDFAATFLVEEELRLATVATATVTAGVAAPVRSMTLGYDESGTRLLLTSVAISAADGTALPAVTFGYTDGDAPTPVSSVLAAPPSQGFKSGVQVFDVNLDGNQDVVDVSSVTGAKWYANTGIGSAAFSAVSTAFTVDTRPKKALVAGGTTSLDDDDRNSALDVFDLGTAKVYHHNGVNGWNQDGDTAVLPAVAWSANSMRFDVDRDGHNDVVDTSTSPWVVYINNGADDYMTDIITCTGATPTFGTTLRASSDGVLQGDVNGDGLLDIVYIAAAKTQAYVYYGRGRGCWGWLPEDGRSNSYETFSITSSVSGPTRNAASLADVTGDGLDDLVMFDSAAGRVNAWKLSPATGWSDAGMGGPFVQSIASANECRLADIDARGVPQALCSNGWKVYRWATVPVGLLATAANGLGVTTTLAYTTSAAIAAQHAAANHAWERNLGSPIQVVASTETSDGRGNVLVTTYDYRNPAIELDELEDRAEYAGFEYVAAATIPYVEHAPGSRVADPADPGVLSRTWFDLGLDDADPLDWFRNGFEVCSETWPGTATPTVYTCGGETGALARTESIYTPVVDGLVTAVVLDARTEHVLEGAASGPILRTEYEHDLYGNLTATFAYGTWDGAANAAGDDEQATATDYIVDTDAWRLRLPKRVQRGRLATAPTPAIDPLEITYFRYDGAATWDVATVTTGLRTATDRWTYDPVTGADSTDQVETTTYTALGLPDLVTDAAGFVTDLDYDAAFGLFPSRRTVDPSGLVLATSTTVDARTGVVTSTTSPDGAIVSSTYDLLGRLTAIIKPGDTALAPTVTRTYVAAAPTSTVTEVSRDGTADGLVSTTVLDGFGRALCTTKEANATKLDVLVQREYSARGQLAVDWNPTRATGCETVTLSAAGRGATRDRDEAVADALGRPVRRTHVPSGTFATWSYAPLEVTASDENDTDPDADDHDTPTTQRVDGRGRIIAVVEKLDSDGDGIAEDVESTYRWTALDQLMAVVDPLATEVFEAQYDTRGRRVWTYDPDRGEIFTTWDARGLIAGSVDPRGAELAYTYDAAGRVLTVSESEGGVAGPVSAFHYDTPPAGYGPAACKFTRGRLAWVTDASGRTVTCYDANGHATRIDRTITAYGPGALRLDRTYDTIDRVKTLTHPDGSKLTWTYGKDGNASKLTIKGSTAAGSPTLNVVSAATYNGTGQPTQLTLGNGSVLGFDYDDRMRPTRFVAKTGTTIHQDLGLALDGVSNVVEITSPTGTFLGAAFTYDALGRLTSASGDRFGGFAASYAYDLRGNLTSKTSTDAGSPVNVGAITYRTDRVHAVDSVGGEVFAYDDAGNLIDDGVYTYDYDAHGMLTSVSAGGAAVMTNVYDHAQRRAVKDSPAGGDVYYFPEAGLEIRGGVSVKHVSFAGRKVMRLTGTFATPAAGSAAVRFFATDHLGSPTLVFDPLGAVVERYASHPHGEDNDAPFVASGHAADFHPAGDPASVLEHRFQGREINAEDGTYDFGARVYRPDLGRFMSPDSIIPDPGSSQSWNRYAFAHNNPIGFIDPSGHSETSTTKPKFRGDEMEAPPPGAVPYRGYGGDKTLGHAYETRSVREDWQALDGNRGANPAALKAATGNDSMSEANGMPPLLSTPTVTGKLEVGAGPVNVELGADHKGVKAPEVEFGSPVGVECSGSGCVGQISVGPGTVKTDGTLEWLVGWGVDVGAAKVLVGIEVATKAGIERAKLYGTRLYEGLQGKPSMRNIREEPVPAATPPATP
jgi:RHS repeat-associated protein